MDTPDFQSLVLIFKKNPEKVHRKCLHTWNDLGVFPIETHIIDSKLIYDKKYKLANDPIIQDNEVYHGQTKDNKKHGIGRLCIKQGGVYEGQFEDD